jgi:hypothetical protein
MIRLLNPQGKSRRYPVWCLIPRVGLNCVKKRNVSVLTIFFGFRCRILVANLTELSKKYLNYRQCHTVRNISHRKKCSRKNGSKSSINFNLLLIFSWTQFDVLLFYIFERYICYVWFYVSKIIIKFQNIAHNTTTTLPHRGLTQYRQHTGKEHDRLWGSKQDPTQLKILLLLKNIF